VVAIVGRPNVGKSRLFNRLLDRQRSIVLDMPGVTRDRIYADATLAGARTDVDVVLVDTGGFDPGSDDPIMRRVLEQTQLAIDEADVVLFLADGRAGVMPEDHDVARLLRRAAKPVVVGVNKLDAPMHDDLLAEFHRLGLADILPVSAAHGRNVGELVELLVEKLPYRAVEEAAIEEPPEAGEAPGEPAGPVRVAVIGRPNVGKSSLVNRLIGEDRHLVSDVAGTTVDAVDSLVEWQGEEFLFIDTAGIRRKRSIALRVEQFSVFAALKGLERSDVALLLLDASEPIAQQDAKVASFSYEKGKAVILVVSKWDKITDTSRKDFLARLHQELPHLTYAPVVFTSAHTGEGFDRLMPAIRKVHREYGRRVPTAKLNQFVRELMETNPPPTKKNKRGKIYYVTQVDVRPPRFLVSVNDPELFHFSYRRFLVNELRSAYGYSGAPVLIGYRSHKEDKDEDKKPDSPGKLRRKTDPKKQATARKRLRKAEKLGVPARRKPTPPKKRR
jgi:GTP-binding protein